MTAHPGHTLEGLLRIRIAEDGPLPFDQFMEQALYHPDFGYYRGGGPTRAGPQGDFVTAPTLTPLYGRALARFVAAAWERMGKPLSWWLVEVGAGTGALAAPLVRAMVEDHPAAAHGMHVGLVDRHPGHRAVAGDAVAGLVPKERLHVGEDLPDAGGRPVVVVANELLDNLPVRLLCRVDGTWCERCVATDPAGGFTWVTRPAPEAWAAWADSFEVPVPDDHQVEVPVGAAAWLDEVSKRLGGTPAVMLLIDYGETARDLLGEPRIHGTLTAYEGHAQDRNVLARVGTRDITAHVNWSAVARAARERGWDVLGYATQSSFLMGLGLMDEAARLGGAVDDVESMALLQAVKEVLLPGGMGERFKVLGLVRGVDGKGTWPGFQDARPVEPAPRR